MTGVQTCALPICLVENIQRIILILRVVPSVGSDDVRTEGMSYGMMICLQLDKPKQFDRLWRWAKTYMRYPDSSPWSGYFCWQCKADGTPFGHSNASDGEVYFATALFMAAHRWNNPQYEDDALDILHQTMTKPCTTSSGGWSWKLGSALVTLTVGMPIFLSWWMYSGVMALPLTR